MLLGISPELILLGIAGTGLDWFDFVYQGHLFLQEVADGGVGNEPGLGGSRIKGNQIWDGL